MFFKDFELSISKINDFPLPGVDAHKKMIPNFRAKELQKRPLDKEAVQRAAVLLLFYPDELNQTRFVLTERTVYQGTHSGQISFPGGKIDFGDNSLWQTALREANEEIGVVVDNIENIAELTDIYIPPSNFLVYPYVGIVRQPQTFVKEVKEVEKIIEIKLSDLLNGENETKGMVTTSYAKNVYVPMYCFGDARVWGATAIILSEMKELILMTLEE